MNRIGLISLILLLLVSCYAAITDERWKRQLFREQIPHDYPKGYGHVHKKHHKDRFNETTPTPQQQSTTLAPEVEISAEEEIVGHPNNNNNNNDNNINNIPYDYDLPNKNTNSVVYFNTINSYAKPLHTSKKYQHLSNVFKYWNLANEAPHYPYSYSWSFRE